MRIIGIFFKGHELMKKLILIVEIIVSLTASMAFGVNVNKPVKVFILAGQSNMEGKAKVSLLDWQIKAPETKELFKHLHKDGKYIERDDVWINFLNRKGKLTVGFGSPGKIGPELEFGNVIGDHFDEQVLLIKTAWGGHSLYQNFRPPSASLPGDEKLAEQLANTNKNNKKKKRPAVTIDDIKKAYGLSYRNMLKEVNVTLSEMGKRFPEYKGQGYEIAGFVWFQGFNDQWGDAPGEYAANMAHFIRDVRKDLKKPKLPFVIGAIGTNGSKPAKGGGLQVRNAQMSMNKIPEFKGNVKAIRTDVLADKNAERLIVGWQNHKEQWEKVGSDRPYHYLGSVIWYSRIGDGFGKAMIDLTKSKTNK